MVKEICNALMEADVNIKLVASLRKSIRNAVNFKDLQPGVNKKRLIQKVRIPRIVCERVTDDDPGCVRRARQAG